MDEAGEVGAAAIAEDCEPWDMSEPSEASFDPVARLVDGGIVRDGELVIAV